MAGLDFEAVSGTLTLTPAAPSQNITVNVYGDTRGENNENFVVNLFNPMGATLLDSQGVATILNDDPPPTVAINDVMVPEGNTATRTAYFSVSLSSYFDQPISIDYATANGTATAGSDYSANTGTITIDPGFRSSVPIPITIIGDTAVEGDETFTVTISNARYGSTPIVITKATGTGTIRDDEGLVEPSTAATWTLVAGGDAATQWHRQRRLAVRPRRELRRDLEIDGWHQLDAALESRPQPGERDGPRRSGPSSTPAASGWPWAAATAVSPTALANTRSS